MYKNLSLGLKVALAPTLALLLLIVVAAVALRGNSALLSAFREVSGEHVPRLLQVKALDSQLKDLQRLTMQSLAWEAIGQKAKAIEDLDQRIGRDLKAFGSKLAEEAGKPGLPTEESSTLAALTKSYKIYSQTATETLDLKSSGVATAAAFVFTLDSAFADCVKSLEALQAFELKAMEGADADAIARGESNTWVILVTSGVALVLASVLGWVIQRRITLALADAVHAARAVASGNLAEPVPVGPGDETGQVLSAMTEMQQNLVRLIGQVRSSADSISTATQEIATGNQDLSARTEQQASELQRTAESMHHMTQSVTQTAESAQRANELAAAAAAVADQGGAVVGRVVETMASISSSSHRIADIVGVIDGIAFQTNILALNAAVEAARAGEQGRGFAVVAGEVRALAQRSANAAREIKGLISESVGTVANGRTLVEEAGSTMTAIVDQVRSVCTLINEIHGAATEQSQSISQVNQAVVALDQGTQQNAALVEQSAAAAESLRHQAADLLQHVTQFRMPG